MTGFSLNHKCGQLIKTMEVQGSIENDLLYKSMQLDIDLQDRFQAEIQTIQQTGAQQLDHPLINQLREKYFAEKVDFLNNLLGTPIPLFASYEKARQEPQGMYAIMGDQSLDPATKQSRS